MPSTEYQTCITKAMREFPKGISREERGELFCVNAKLCSGKASNENEAKRLCADRPPPAPRGTGKRRGLDAGAIAACLMPKLTEEISVAQLAGFISTCSGQVGGPKIKKPQSQAHFVKVCAMKAAMDMGKDFATLKMEQAVKLRKSCLEEWKATQEVSGG